MWLLVEDDPDIRTIVAMMMTVWGEEPLAFPDGRAAWSWLDTVETGSHTGTLPELALMDIRMPGYTGDQIAARIRMIPALKHIPIILMTAFNKSDDEVEALRKTAGIDYFLNKPLPDMDDFRDTLYRVRDQRLAKQTQAAQAAPPPAVEPTPAPAPVSETPPQSPLPPSALMVPESTALTVSPAPAPQGTEPAADPPVPPANPVSDQPKTE
ncbi:MAG: response regulator [Anaerolinea sp.]|nr:response regulator [Anaerolinea sp.]MCC6975317.1 response regulator [Anaerolineae bacterium]CAG1011633.1 Transcriptional regulatory protein ZraR [Anaerolineae bacterium]